VRLQGVPARARARGWDDMFMCACMHWQAYFSIPLFPPNDMCVRVRVRACK